MTASGSSSGAEVPAVELRGITKDFGGNRALDNVDLSIGHGEVVGLVGQNGSGKSTLVKVLSGVHEPSPGGRLFVGGAEVPLPLAPGSASELGLSFVYQNLALAPGLTVLENLTFGQRVRGGVFNPINWRAEHRDAAAVLRRYQVVLDLDTAAGDLPPVDQARLAIVRAAEDLRRFRSSSGAGHSVLVLDEPTVFLPEEEVERLFGLVRTVVAEGAAVLFISHDLAAVRSIADRVVVIRDGRTVAEVVPGETEESELVDLIVGASTAVSVPDSEEAAEGSLSGILSPSSSEPDVAIVVDRLSGGRLRDLSLEIGAGEILGVAGLIGSGAEEVPYRLFGASPGSSGELRLGEGALDVARLSPARSVAAGLALVPADRNTQGLVGELTLWENIVMPLEDEHYTRGVFRRSELVELAADAIDRFGIRPALPRSAAGTFSGGNQQKALIAKWLLARPRFLLLHEPTQGVDVGARRDIYGFVKAAAALSQMAVLWVTTDFAELAEVCDRVIVLSEGRPVTTLAGQELSDDAISAATLRQIREVS